MLSLRSTTRTLDPSSQVISMRHLAHRVSLQPPISVRCLNEMSLLTGYAISIDIDAGFIDIDTGLDHTYVTSNNPCQSWPCWGRGSGGKEICRGYGKYSLADYISQPNSHAGIEYGVTGVCHQTANRILYPARVIVSKARGYAASSYAYGTYGSSPFEFLESSKICESSSCTLKSRPSTESLDSDMRVYSNSIDEPKKTYLQKVVDLYTEQMKILPGFCSTTMSEESSPLQGSKIGSFSSTIKNEDRYSLLGKEFELMIEFCHGDNLDPQITSQVLKQQLVFLKEKGKMDNEFYSADLNIEKYVKEVNDLFGDLLIILPDILGKDEYEQIFDLSPSEKGFVLIDPNIAIKAHAKM